MPLATCKVPAPERLCEIKEGVRPPMRHRLSETYIWLIPLGGETEVLGRIWRRRDPPPPPPSSTEFLTLGRANRSRGGAQVDGLGGDGVRGGSWGAWPGAPRPALNSLPPRPAGCLVTVRLRLPRARAPSFPGDRPGAVPLRALPRAWPCSRGP